MIISLTGLIAFQWYWVEHAIAVKNEQFDRKVMEVLKETIHKIEKQEVIYLTKQKILATEKNRLLEISKKKHPKKPQNEISITANTSVDSMNFAFLEGNVIKMDPQEVFSVDINSKNLATNDVLSNKLFFFTESESQFVKNILNEEDQAFENFKQKALINAQKQRTLQHFLSLMNQNHFAEQKEYNISIVQEEEEDFFQNKKSKPRKTRLRKNTPKNINDSTKIEIVKDVFKEFILGKRSVEERMGYLMLDTLLKSEFKNAGIYVPFEYNVQDEGNNIYRSTKNGRNLNEKDKVYKIKLFSNDTYSQNQFLNVNFPEKQNFILSNLWSVFGSSFLLICMVGGVFYYSVNTMLSQKKLALIKNDFLNNMTHELKTPVSTIGLALEVINDKSIEQNPLKTERYLAIIYEENQRLGTQIEKVLQIAQLEKGDIKLCLENLNINEIIVQVVSSMSIQLNASLVKLHTQLNATETTIRADKIHIANILVNLIDNAIKYGKENPEIWISTENINDSLLIKVRDNGIGIPADQQTKIFDKFYRVPKGNLHDVKGFGLGLSYVKSMLTMHHSIVKVESKVNVGSVFSVYLPLYKKA